MEATISSLAVRRSTRSKRIGLVCTVIMVAMAGVGGVLDLAQYNFPLARGLGMPWFVGIILGVCKLLALATFLTRRVPTLREWAYAGLTFGLLGAAACHILSRSPVYYAVPALFDWSFCHCFLPSVASSSKGGPLISGTPIRCPLSEGSRGYTYSVKTRRSPGASAEL
jgi:DoxX-like family